MPIAVSEANDVERRLAHTVVGRCGVRPVLAFTRTIKLKAMPADVEVLEAEVLYEWFLRQPRVLTRGEVDEIARIADLPATWL